MSEQVITPREHIQRDHRAATPRRKIAFLREPDKANAVHGKISKGTEFEAIINNFRQPPEKPAMETIEKRNSVFMIKPFKFDQSNPDREPTPIFSGSVYLDRWDENHVRMPCSRSFKFVYSHDERAYFMSTVLSNICDLALNVDKICSRPPPLLRIGTNLLVTMSQRQAASLLACAFFCLFPFRHDDKPNEAYANFQDPNFKKLYIHGPPQKIEKVRCILHYFKRITEKMPTGVITFRRYSLPDSSYPDWLHSNANISPLHLTTGEKIEDVNCVLQVDFANQYIGGGVLGTGCVQEEIRFTICPEMLVSLLVCEKMESNECIFLIGCERYSSYDGYADSFHFAGNYKDTTPKDNWGQKWCHVVAMDAIYFRNPTVQYQMKCVRRELIKAYASFRPRPAKNASESLFGIATGNWGCGAFNGSKQLKAIIQLMTASEAGRPLVYAAYLDGNLVNSFFDVYQYLLSEEAKSTICTYIRAALKWQRLVNTDFSKPFRLTPQLNSKNDIIWSTSRQVADKHGGYYGRKKFAPGVMLWGGISWNGLIPREAPVLIDEFLEGYQWSKRAKKTMNGTRYADLIRTIAYPAIMQQY
ncbi:unnamed protein product [Rotaria sp. Silwood1]|nr:unnamed protein product [Rotaria sp. Silwood1]CAF3436946.1 unnamed protein product [Rotaria sp. Silwood1]CAF4887260.1 unnamed protein product [Rotaria sp. Silwood1]CAF5074543.1 unnamed protein product [Rotaria sp. Silwood1]